MKPVRPLETIAHSADRSADVRAAPEGALLKVPVQIRVGPVFPAGPHLAAVRGLLTGAAVAGSASRVWDDMSTAHVNCLCHLDRAQHNQ